MEAKKMPGMETMIQGYKDIIIERDHKVEESVKAIKDEYEAKLAEHKKEMHKELDRQVRGLS
jgi:hypothetical protein